MVLGLGAGLALDKIFRKGTEVKPSETEVLTPQPQQIKSPTISIPKRIIQPPEQKPLNIWQRFFGGIFQGKEQDEPEIIPQRSVRPTLEDMRALTQKTEMRKGIAPETYKDESIPTGLTAAQYQAQKEGRLVNAQSQGQLLVGLAANKFDYAGGEQQWSEWKTPGVEIRILGADKRLDVKGALDLATSIASDPTTYALGAPARIGAKAVGEAGEIAGKAIAEGVERVKPAIREFATSERAVGNLINPDEVVNKFVKSINDPENLRIIEADKTALSKQKQTRFDALGEIMDANPDLPVEEAAKKSLGALKGKYERQTLKLGDLFDEGERNSLFQKVADKFPDKSDPEFISHLQALQKALDEGIISNVKGIKGGSQRTRLEDVFGKPFVDSLEEAKNKLAELPSGKGVEWMDFPENTGAKQIGLTQGVENGTVKEQLKVAGLSPTAEGKALKALKSLGINSLDALNVPRSFITAFDVSAAGRQGLQLAVAHPYTAAKNFGRMLKSLVSAEDARFYDEQVKNVLHRAGERARKLYIAPLEIKQGISGLAGAEESFMSRIAQKIPGVKQSQRAYVTFLNKMRADVFDQGMKVMEQIPDTNLNDYDALASLINAGSGRGDLRFFGKDLANASPILNALLFSPRLIMSRLEYVPRLVQAYATGNRPLQIEATKQIAGMLAFGGSILGLYKLSGGKLEKDPRSAEFGKVKIGESRIDVWAGYLQYIKLLARLTTGSTKTTAGYVKPQNQIDSMVQFIQSKESPALGLFMDIAKGQTLSGDEMALTPESIKTQAYNRLVPLFIQDLMDALKENGTGQGIAAGTLSGLGVGVVTYPTPPETQVPELSRLGINIKNTSNTINGIEMSDTEKERYQKMLYDEIIPILQIAVRLPSYTKLTDEQKKDYLERELKVIRAKVRKDMLAQGGDGGGHLKIKAPPK